MTATEKLISMIPKMNAVEFTGLARVLNVRLIEKNENSTSDEDKYINREFTDVLNDVLYTFDHLNRTQKRNVLKIIKASNSVSDEELKEMLDARNSKHSETTE